MSRAVIAGYARTPFHFARKGKLAAVRPDDLAAIALRGLVTRLGLEPALVEDVLMGCAYPEGEQGTNVARIATLLAGFPDTVAGATINRFCGSSMTAVHYAAGQIAIGAGEAFICAGVESMTRVPQGGFSFSPNPRFRGPNTPVAEFPIEMYVSIFFFSSRRRHTRSLRDWSSDVCSSDLATICRCCRSATRASCASAIG